MKPGHEDAGPHQQEQTPSEPADPLFQKAISHHQAGQLAEAEALYREILPASPSHSGALYYYGMLALQIGQTAVALELIDGAIQVNPEYAEAYFSRGNALYVLQQYQPSA